MRFIGKHAQLELQSKAYIYGTHSRSRSPTEQTSRNALQTIGLLNPFSSYVLDLSF